MNSRSSILALIVGLALLPTTHAAMAPTAQTEIGYLLHFVGTSGCQFYRNGTWYSPETAQAHLRSKYEKIVSRVQIDSAEDFIAKVATKSSMSGQPYKAKCHGAEPITSSQWLNDALARHRSIDAAGAHPT